LLLVSDGVEHGLLGPRERDRIWDRHLLNCAVVAELIPVDARVVDVGSGAGLPGLALACARPDLRVDLVESLTRRVRFLENAVEVLRLGDRVRVVHGRAEAPATRAAVGESDWVTARALAPLDRLVRWCLPLLLPGGTLLALKGARAEEDVAEHRDAIGRTGGRGVHVVRCGQEVLVEPTVVVVIQRRCQDDRG
jgi:16S rRNA (guanine527-N7)-methyltransferase